MHQLQLLKNLVPTKIKLRNRVLESFLIIDNDSISYWLWVSLLSSLEVLFNRLGKLIVN